MEHCVGLTNWAQGLVNEDGLIGCTRIVHPAGHRDAFAVLGDDWPLMRYALADGRVLDEYCQDERNGIAFLALREHDGAPVPESLWSEDEITDRAGPEGPAVAPI